MLDSGVFHVRKLRPLHHAPADIAVITGNNADKITLLAVNHTLHVMKFDVYVACILTAREAAQVDTEAFRRLVVGDERREHVEKQHAAIAVMVRIGAKPHVRRIAVTDGV